MKARRHGVCEMSEPGPSPTSETIAAIDIVRHTEIWDGMGGVSDTLLARAALAAVTAVTSAGDAPHEITLVLTDDGEMRELNNSWRGKDASTNVLSFPAGAPISPGGGPVPLGDIVLAAETVRAEAEQQGISVADHVTHLVVHGVLHLLGYDHEGDEEAESMEGLETRILAALGVADPYAEARKGPRAELAR